ncbi:ROK family protein [Paenibacillus residui]|uniref:ROK family protein n=1 Tax=Paenibacillus residui TaxID=629724 RepID=A0ABW3D6C4_9BACL
MGKYIIGIDVGGTNIQGGLIDPHGRIVSRAQVKTDAPLGADKVIERIAGIAGQLLEQSGVNRNEVAGIGAGVPGFIDVDRGVVLSAANLQWKDVPLAERLNNLTGLPVCIHHDVRMYVYGEAIQGAGRSFKHVLGLTIGTGLAAAYIDQGRILCGSKNMAGELGHIPMRGEQARCSCGMQGCLETVVSARGLIRQVTEAVRSGRPSRLAGLALREPGELTADAISAAYDEGDELAAEVYRHTGRLLGYGLAYAVTLLSPDVVIIGGGVASAGEKLLAPVRETLQASILPKYWSHLKIKTAQLGNDAGLIGSAAYARTKLDPLPE